jgi:hypothetical protein
MAGSSDRTRCTIAAQHCALVKDVVLNALCRGVATQNPLGLSLLRRKA